MNTQLYSNSRYGIQSCFITISCRGCSRISCRISIVSICGIHTASCVQSNIIVYISSNIYNSFIVIVSIIDSCQSTWYICLINYRRRTIKDNGIQIIFRSIAQCISCLHVYCFNAVSVCKCPRLSRITSCPLSIRSRCIAISYLFSSYSYIYRTMNIESNGNSSCIYGVIINSE